MNQSDFPDEYMMPLKTSFVYATFLQPGYHMFLIYDPLNDRAFCKDIVVELSKTEVYPELPA